jgi:hypothetical protein
MLSTKKTQQAAAARARAVKSQKNNVEVLKTPGSANKPSESDVDSDCECTGWTGGVNFVPSDSDSDSDKEWKDTDLDEDSDEDGNESLELDLEGVGGLPNKWELQQELEDLAKPTPYEHILRKTTGKEWKKVEGHRGLGYNGQSTRRKREIAQELRKKEEQNRQMREGWVLTYALW